MEKRIQEEVIGSNEFTTGAAPVQTLDEFQLAFVGGGIGDTVL